ncbi:MAG TPA: Rieske 2Fe-2S domain-containing protein [Sphingomicrobium sp.]|nr:Rieske 2Fe-2S domain-containing protein [Sphingomicrobium sp.]
MLSREDNDLMCRVGPDTPQGRALRRYWTPALQTSDLPEPGGDPRAIRLLGQDFVAFRGTDGKVGLLNEHCCHRAASLALGRVEGCAIRCLFHGWKFAADGELLEAPNVSEEGFRRRVRQPSYPVREAGGLIWVYLGPVEMEPPFPHYPWFDLPQEHRINAYLVEEANFIQVQEALVDSSHLNILHADGLNRGKESDLAFAANTQPLLLAADPRVEAEATDFGFHYAALRPNGDQVEARIAAFIAPYSVANPNGDLWMSVVPIDDTHSIYFHVWWNANENIGLEPGRTEHLKFIGLDNSALAAFGMTYDTINDPDKPSRRNGFKQNREAMRQGRTFTGFNSFTQEDSAVLMSAGALKDRSNENLCRADMAISRLYRVHLQNAKSMLAGEEPVGVHYDPSGIIGIQGSVPPEGWQALVPNQRSKAKDRTEASAA